MLVQWLKLIRRTLEAHAAIQQRRTPRRRPQAHCRGAVPGWTAAIIDTLEPRTLLSGVALQSVTAGGAMQLTLTYEIQGETAAFNIGFYRSVDTSYGGDLLLDTITVSEPADLTAGAHVKTLDIGTAPNQVALPGAGAAEVNSDYSIIAVAHVLDAVFEDNATLLHGVYHAPGKDVLVHGRGDADSITVDSNQQLSFDGIVYAYAAVDVTRFRIRAHGGNDVISGGTATKPLSLFGGAGEDLLTGGSAADSLFGNDGSDTLTGGGGNDQLDGGHGSDHYAIAGTAAGTDKFADSGTVGLDRIVAGSNDAVIRVPQQFSAATSGIEAIDGNGFANVRILATSAGDALNFSNMTLTHVAFTDAGAGADSIVGSPANDRFKGGAGNDTIDGGAGRDTVEFAGGRASYSIVQDAGVVVVTDLAPTTHGNDGTDTLQRVEVLKFRDGEFLTSLPNVAPVAVHDSVSISEDAPSIILDVLANDTDADAGDTRTVLSVDGSGTEGWMELILIYGVGVGIWHPGIPAVQGTVSVTADGRGVHYAPGSAFQGLKAGETATETFFYSMADSAGARSTTHVTVIVNGANDAPVAVADGVALAGNAAPVTIDVLANDGDADLHDTKRVLSIDTRGLTGTATLAADGSSVLYAVGDAFRSLTDGQTVTETFAYTMVDGFGAQSTAIVTVMISGSNQAPVATPDGAAATENGPSVTIDVLANDTDADVGDTRRVVSVNTAGLQGTVLIGADGSHVVYTVGASFQGLRAGVTATDTFSYAVVDRGGAQSTATVTVTVTGVNDAPVAVADGIVVSEDSAPVTIDVLANDRDLDAGDTKTVVAINATGLRGVASVAPSGAGVVYAVGNAYQGLRAGQTATERFTYTMIDSAGAASTASVTVTVTGANDAPIAVANSVSISEDAGATRILVLTNDIDADVGDTKRVVAVNNTAGLRGTATTDGTAVIYTVGSAFQGLIAGETATETLSYTMVDGAGVQSTASVNVTVLGVTDGPKAFPDSAAADEDGGPITLDVLANDIHDLHPGTPLTVHSVDVAGSPPTIELILIYGVGVGFINPGFPATQGTVTVGPVGQSVVYTPHQSLRAGQTAVDFFRYTVRDEAGALSTSIGSVTVTGADDAPVAVADSRTIPSDAAPVALGVLANDTDADAGDTRRVVAVNGAGLRGGVSMASDGSDVIYAVGGALADLPFGQSATETFTYTIADASGLRSTATVTVTVTGRNLAPVAVADTASATEDGPPVTVDVLANDTDPDAAAGDTKSLVSINATGLSGTVAIGPDGSSVVYTVGNAFQGLKAGATATETFSYTMQDALGLRSTTTVRVTVTGVNDAVVAVADRATVSEDAAPLAIAVLANDTDVDADDVMRVTQVDGSSLRGTVAVAADGLSVLYSVGNAFQYLNNGQTVTETFRYTVRDSGGAQSTAVVTITVVGANEPVVYVTPPPPPPGAIVGGAGDDILNGSSAADVIYGMAGDDVIYAGGGGDTVFGGADSDEIDGGDGDDVLNGGAGRDDLTGGYGADTFRFYLATDSIPADFDRIRDFDSSQRDKIDLSLIDANTMLGENNAFVIVTSFTGIAGQLVITVAADGTTLVAGDVNGDGIADLLFEVRTDAQLTSDDFLL